MYIYIVSLKMKVENIFINLYLFQTINIYILFL